MHQIRNLLGEIEKNGSGTSEVYAGVLDNGGRIELNEGQLHVFGNLPSTTDAIRLIYAADLHLKGDTVLDLGYSNITSYDSSIEAIPSGPSVLQHLARVVASKTPAGGGPKGNLYVQNTGVYVGGGPSSGDGKMLLLMADSELHMTNSQVGVTLNFAAAGGISVDKLSCKKIVRGAADNFLIVGAINVPALIPDFSLVCVDTSAPGDLFQHYLLPVGVANELVGTTDVKIKKANPIIPPES
jgi:hypothetical protein